MPITLPPDATDPENPRLAWRNLVTPSNLSASSQGAGFPAVNLTNPTTFQLWRAAAIGAVSVTVDFGEALDVDYIGFARHNFGSAGISYDIHAFGPGADIYVPIPNTLPVNDGVILHSFPRLQLNSLTIYLGAGTAPAQAAVLMIGTLTTLQRRIYVGHTPINYGKQTTVSTGMSESGQFLGRVIRRRQYQTSIKQQNLDPEWYREHLAPFDEVAAVQPFFFAWRPYPYREEVGYCWANGDTEFVNQRANGMVEWGMSNVQGIIR